MIILHGDNVIKSRQRLVELEETIRQQGGQIALVSAKLLTPQLLEESLGSRSLFNIEQTLVIEELHSLPESAKKKQLIALLTKTDLPVILWGKRLLSATMLKKFARAQVESFKVTNQLFSWLDSLGSVTNKTTLIRQFHKLNQVESVQFCFTMLIRQIRLLISALDDGQLAGAPFIIAKLKQQARQFSLAQLLAIHHQLLAIDLKEKRSTSTLNLEQELDLLLLSV